LAPAWVARAARLDDVVDVQAHGLGAPEAGVAEDV
jgi:hypothetical protein